MQLFRLLFYVLSFVQSSMCKKIASVNASLEIDI